MGEVIEHCACSPSWWCGAAELVSLSLLQVVPVSLSQCEGDPVLTVDTCVMIPY